jgi:hypothetical protein
MTFIRRQFVLLAGAFALTAACSDAPNPRPEAAAEPRTEGAPEPEREPDEDRAAEIRARNQAILERVEREQLEAQHDAPARDEAKTEPAPAVPDETPTRSGMEEMQARADELEPRVAAIGDIAERVDENYRRYMDACYEKYTAATASPHAAMDYYDPYQPLAISNETTPYCRKLWSDIERDAEAVELAMQALTEEARRRGVLPGHVRELAREYNLDRNGWRP